MIKHGATIAGKVDTGNKSPYCVWVVALNVDQFYLLGKELELIQPDFLLEIERESLATAAEAMLLAVINEYETMTIGEQRLRVSTAGKLLEAVELSKAHPKTTIKVL